MGNKENKDWSSDGKQGNVLFVGYDTIGRAITNGLKFSGYNNPTEFKGVPYVILPEGKFYISDLEGGGE